MIDIKFYIKIIVAALIIAAVAYGVHLYKEKNFSQERTVYRNTIAETALEKESLIVKEKEHEAIQAFERVEEKIDAESNATRAYTIKKVQDEDITEFTDSF